MTSQPRVFVGASSEAHEHERLVHDGLEQAGIEPIPWRHSFRPGEYGLDSLERIANSANGAVLIASADDKTWYRGQESFSPRDNVLFELGYFLQCYGRSGTALVQVENELGVAPRVPTDLAGLTAIRFRHGARADNSDQIRGWAERFQESFRPTHPEVAQITSILQRGYGEMDHDWQGLVREFVLAPFQRSLASALRGELPLTPGQYYNRLDREIADSGSETAILAVSTVTSQVWSSDRDQQDYFDRNLEAANRGARIRRLFILPEELHEAMFEEIREQAGAGIAVRVVRPGTAADISTLEDIVLFIRPGSPWGIRGYVALPSFNNPGRIRAGRLLLDADLCLHQRDVFEAAWSIAAAPEHLQPARRGPAPGSPPGDGLRANWLSGPVYTCEQAAAARNVPLENELKTLILTTSSGVVAAHLRGDSTASLRAVKEALEAEEASLASDDVLRELGLRPGTVCAVLNPVWSLPHLIERSVLLLDYVTTNNATTTGWFRFDPKVLLGAGSYTVADFRVASGEDQLATG